MKFANNNETNFLPERLSNTIVFTKVYLHFKICISMGAEQGFYSDELKRQTKENMKNVLRGFDMQKLKKIYKKALKKEDHEIVEVVETIFIELVVKNF